MRIKANHILFFINALTLLLILVIAFLPDNILRIILGLPLVLFFPGYALISALFHRKSNMESVERIALSLALSIAIAALIGLVLNYTSWGINLNSVLISLTIFVVVTSTIAWFRQRKLPDEDKFAFHIDLASWGKQSLLNKTISVILVTVILGTIGVLIYTIATPKTGEKSTEFYILGLEGKAVDYPEDLELGDTGKVILGIINREQDLVNYRVEIKVDGILNGTFGPITLQPDEKSESEVGFTPPQMGDHQKIEFLLYKNDQNNAYSGVYFWVNVR